MTSTTSQETPAAQHAVPADWERVYRALARGRRFDELALKLQRQGAIDSYGEARGQEGAQIGAVIDLGEEDMVFPSYRQPGVALERGVTPLELMRFYAGIDYCPWDWRAHCFGPVPIPVGSQLAHATGWAWAQRLKGEGGATVVFCGDGATSQGEVHEAMNYGGVFDAPVVYLVENNGWAISTPTANQTRTESIANRAIGYGIAGVSVDGNDVLAVREAAATALERARSGAGPTLIEARTYRLGGHTTSDDPGRYRTTEASAEWETRDPLRRFAAVVADVPGSAERMAELEAEADRELQSSIDEFLAERGMA